MARVFLGAVISAIDGRSGAVTALRTTVGWKATSGASKVQTRQAPDAEIR